MTSRYVGLTAQCACGRQCSREAWHTCTVQATLYLVDDQEANRRPRVARAKGLDGGHNNRTLLVMLFCPRGVNSTTHCHDGCKSTFDSPCDNGDQIAEPHGFKHPHSLRNQHDAVVTREPNAQMRGSAVPGAPEQNGSPRTWPGCCSVAAHVAL